MILSGSDVVVMGRDDVLKITEALKIAKLVGGRGLMLQWAESQLLMPVDQFMDAAKKIKEVEETVDEFQIEREG